MKSRRYEHPLNYVLSVSVIFSGGLREMNSEKIKTHYTLQKFYRNPELVFELTFGATLVILLSVFLRELIMVQIDQGIALPTNRSKYPFGEMETGDSILFKLRKQAESCRVAALRFSRVHQPDWTFSLRKVDNGWRLWRIK